MADSQVTLRRREDNRRFPQYLGKILEDNDYCLDCGELIEDCECNNNGRNNNDDDLDNGD